MKKLRTRFNEIKEGFLTGKAHESVKAYLLANDIFIWCVFTIIYAISAVIYIFYETAGICMIAISIILLFVFLFWKRAFAKVIPISARILDYFFGRYGQVVTKSDWKHIKKTNKHAYKFIWDKKNIGHCYMVAWVLAMWLEDAKIMFCSIRCPDGGQTGHAVVVKNNCVYDTNCRKHRDFDEYIKLLNAEVYQIFEEEEYSKRSFFDDARQGFMDWCAERDVYCNPQ